MLQLRWGRRKKKTQRDTTFWRERVNFIVAPRQSLYLRARDFGVQFVQAEKNNFQLNSHDEHEALAISQ